MALTLPQNKTLGELTAVLKEHHEPQPLVIAKRFHFHQCSQAVVESILGYVAKWRRLTTHCKYGAHLDEALRYRLLCGLQNDTIQKKVLSEVDLTLARAMEIVQGMEAAEKNARSLKKGEDVINQVLGREFLLHALISPVGCPASLVLRFLQICFFSSTATIFPCFPQLWQFTFRNLQSFG